MSESKTSPIFIHSLWRSGSTYLFNVFRRSASGYWCYQEPIHEAALFHQDNPEGLLQFQGEAMRALRHPDLDRPYFLELYETHGYWQGVINKSIIYDEYFDTTCSETLKNYLLALIDGAKGRPVIQECRTSNRIKAIKEAMGGTHLHLWRNPWDQWWSFKSTLYFDVVVQLAINGPQPPASIERLRKEIGFSEFHDGNISREFEHFDALRPSAADSYLSFYMLWCLGWLEGYRHADATINIDQLTESASYRESTLAALKKLGIDGLDFGDCQIHRTLYAANEEAFFRTIEERVHGLLLASGMTSADIDIINKFRREQTPSRQLEMPRDIENNNVLEDAVRAREITIRLETGAHDRISRQINAHLNREHELTNQLVQVEQKAQQADAEQAKNFADKEARWGGEIASLRQEKAEELAQAVQRLAVRERELMEKSEAVRSEMQLLERAWAERERKLQADATVLQEEGNRQAQQHLKELAQLQEQQRQEHEALLHAKAEREQEFAQQLLKIQQEAEQTRREHEQSLRAEHAGREAALAALLQEKEKELQQLEESLASQQKALSQELAQLQERQRQEHEALLRDQTQREQEFAQQLLKIQQESEQARREHGESLRTEHAGREAALAARLQEKEKELQRLEQRQAEQQEALSQELTQLQEQQHQEHEALLRTQAQREQEFAQQLFKVQQEAEKSRREQEQILRSEHAERETILSSQLREKGKNLRRLEQSWFEQQKALSKELSQLKEQQHKEYEALLRTQTQREQTFAAQLLALQQEAEGKQEKLIVDQAARESLFSKKIAESQQQMESMLLSLAQREQEFAQQLLAVQQESEQTRRAQEQALRAEHAGREKSLTERLHADQQELRRLKQEWATHEKGLDKEIAGLRSEIQSLQHAQQLQSQQYDFELTTRDAEHNRLIQAGTELEAMLNGQIQAEQLTSLQLRKALAEVQQTLVMTHASLSWRMTTPLRKLTALFSPSVNYGSPPTMVELATPPPAKQADSPLAEEQADSPLEESRRPLEMIMPTVAVPQSVTIQQTPMELIMPSPATTVASTLNELLFLHDQAFIQCAYLTLLGRAADPEGFQYYLGRLRYGASKIQILGQLRCSSEGKARACNLPGLDAAIRRNRWAQNPLTGWLVRLFYVVDENSESARKLRRIENQLLILSDESNRRFNQMETAVAGLHHLVVQQTQTIVAAMGSARLDTPDGSAITLIKQPEPDGLKHLSSRARNIYFQLKSAAAIYAGRAA